MKRLSGILFFTLLIFCSSQNGLSQDTLKIASKKVGFSAGIGFTDMMNIKVRVPLHQFQIALGAGFMPLKEENVLSVTGDVYYHFAGTSKYTGQRPWFLRTGVDYFKDEADSFTEKYLFLGVRAGRVMNISKVFAIDLDAGAGFTLWHEATGDMLDIKPKVLPLISLSFVFMF